MSDLARIAVARAFGAPENIQLEKHPVSALGSGQIRVAVRTGGLNPVDARRRAGKFGGSVPMVFGTEFAGVVVESTDPKVAIGTEVIGWGAQGADADLVTSDASRIHPKPQEISWDLAGGISGVGQTALTALNSLQLNKGDTIVVHGASGGVGTVLVQMAAARGLIVIGTAGESNQEYLRSIGAIPVTYGNGVQSRIDEAAEGSPIAASIDLAGSYEAGDVSVAVVRAGGQAITLVPETMSSHGLRLVQVRHTPTQLQELLNASIDGSLVLPVEAIPFVDVAEAHRRLDSKHATGKIVLDLSDNPFLTEIA